MKRFERLGEARTPRGTLIEFYRHDGQYLLRADGVELMSSRRHLSEDRLADVACAGLQDAESPRVLIGGLGLGFTLRAALGQLPASAEVVVAELLPEVIAWNANPGYGISVEALADPRVRMVQDDVVHVLDANRDGFDAIMLDTDNGPDGMLISESAALYAERGVARTLAALREGGTIVYWSVAEDRPFARLLRRAGLNVEAMQVPAHATASHMHTLYRVRPPRR